MAKQKIVDMHVHSYYSDGTLSPEEIVQQAVSNNVGILSVCDHDLIMGSLEMPALCKGKGIKYIHGVEVDALDGEKNVHILAYGYDANNREFVQFLKETRAQLYQRSVLLVKRMQDDGKPVSAEEFERFSYDRTLGGWGLLHYAVEKGLAPNIKKAMELYNQYQVGHETCRYSGVAEVCAQIKKAGGSPVIAHPIDHFDGSDYVKCAKELQRYIKMGFDGIECYYPTHPAKLTQICLDMCMKHKLMVTAGSDCHGAFGKTKIGEMKIPMDAIQIRKLLQ